jgi:hypothetical protein
VAQGVQSLPSKCEALSLNPGAAKKKKEKEESRSREVVSVLSEATSNHMAKHPLGKGIYLY